VVSSNFLAIDGSAAAKGGGGGGGLRTLQEDFTGNQGFNPGFRFFAPKEWDIGDGEQFQSPIVQ
jgi:hypothetical protein